MLPPFLLMRLIILIAINSMLLMSCSTTTVYIVRHAEKESEADSAELNPAGRQRARALVDVLASVGIDSIFTTPYRRTRQTAEPLSKRIHVPLAEYPTRPDESIVNRIRAIRNKTVLVVGHSNTILVIAKGLGTHPIKTTIEAGDFDNLLRVRMRQGLFSTSVRLTETTYGQPTPP